MKTKKFSEAVVSLCRKKQNSKITLPTRQLALASRAGKQSNNAQAPKPKKTVERKPRREPKRHSKTIRKAEYCENQNFFRGRSFPLPKGHTVGGTGLETGFRRARGPPAGCPLDMYISFRHTCRPPGEPSSACVQ